MKTTNELIIRGERTHLERLLARVEALLRDGWKRDREAEERLGRHGVRGPWDYCFSCTATADRPAAGFWVHPRSFNELSISHVISLGKETLKAGDAHRLLAEFQRDFLGPAAAEVGAETELVQHRHTLEDELSSEAVRLLRAFAVSTPRACLRSDDRRRWNAFLVRVHQDESLIDPALLDEWLRQEGWPADTRGQLVAEHEAARSLLETYDEETERR